MYTELRWLATAGPEALGWEADRALDPELVHVLGDLCLETTPLRMQSETITPFVQDTARAWSRVYVPRGMEFFPGFAWPVPRAFASAVSGHVTATWHQFSHRHCPLNWTIETN